MQSQGMRKCNILKNCVCVFKISSQLVEQIVALQLVNEVKMSQEKGLIQD